jgi:polyphenol oxidase
MSGSSGAASAQGSAYPAGWIVPQWPAPPSVRALITARAGGSSTGPYASFNLGWGTGDDPLAVRTNRARLSALLPQEPRWLKQVHGATVVAADPLTGPVAADASIARNPGTVCAVLVADCLPVLFTDREGTRVAAAHAGWRGLALGVLENTVAAMTADGLPPDEVLAYLGPAIGPAAFEVGEDVREAFRRRDAADLAAFTPLHQGKWHADLPGLARRALARAGVTRVYGEALCTVSDRERFFSYRRDGTTGRMGAFVWRS